MRTYVELRKLVRCSGFSVRKTVKGIKVTTAWGNARYFYPQQKDYGFYIQEYLKYATKPRHIIILQWRHSQRALLFYS